MSQVTPRCLSCGKQPGCIRGHCDRCLQQYDKAIQDGLLNWKNLEYLGLVRPPEPGNPHPRHHR